MRLCEGENLLAPGPEVRRDDARCNAQAVHDGQKRAGIETGRSRAAEIGRDVLVLARPGEALRGLGGDDGHPDVDDIDRHTSRRRVANWRHGHSAP